MDNLKLLPNRATIGNKILGESRQRHRTQWRKVQTLFKDYALQLEDPTYTGLIMPLQITRIPKNPTDPEKGYRDITYAPPEWKSLSWAINHLNGIWLRP